MKKHVRSLLFIALAASIFSCKKEIRGADVGESSPGGPPSDITLLNNGPSGTIVSNFNGTPISKGNYIWFNAHFNASGINTDNYVDVTNVYITLENGTPIPLPDSRVTFSSSAPTSTGSYSNGIWNITVPNGFAGNIFFTGFNYPITANIPGGMNPVSLTATFTSNKPGGSLNWQWSAAVYSQFTDNLSKNMDNLVITDRSGAHAGQPLNYKGNAIGGARGGGAGDMTGSWSATGHVNL